jgi:ABC-type microcin C transport system permease subunit YejB
MAEWSKATDSSSVLFGGVSSNLTGCILFDFVYCLCGLGLVGYDVCLTHRRCRVQSSEPVYFYIVNGFKTLWPSG